MNRFNKLLTFPIYIILILISSCNEKSHKQTDQPKTPLHSDAYDNSILNSHNAPFLLPYNRIIEPAGTTIHFGDPKVENHSMDCIVLSDHQTLVVEDRYGLSFFNIAGKRLISRVIYGEADTALDGCMSTYSGVKALKKGNDYMLYTSIADRDGDSYVLEVKWNGSEAHVSRSFPFNAKDSAGLALPNDIALSRENNIDYLYVVLNGNSELTKLRLSNGKPVWSRPTGMAPFGIAIANGQAFVTNWAGPKPLDTTKETAGIPWSKAYIDPKTGATNSGTVSVINIKTGKKLNEINVGLHPNSIILSPDKQFAYIANANSDNVSVIDTKTDKLITNIPVSLSDSGNKYIGDSPNGLAIDSPGTRLYVSNGMDNAVAVIQLGKNVATNGADSTSILGFIPTGAYPAGLALDNGQLFVANLEGEGSRVAIHESGKKASLHIPDELKKDGVYNVHHEEATVSIIPLPDEQTLHAYTQKVQELNLSFRTQLSSQLPRPSVAARAVPERIGEPSLIKHVVYIIKENRTYDQVLGDMDEGRGAKSLCIFGDSVTPNEHQLARNFILLDNYYASGKCSAEGHQWTDAAMVTDYVEKNVRAWFRSYPHVQNDALVYDQQGFIWNQALDHGKSVRIYGEASSLNMDDNITWTDIYNDYLQNKPFQFTNTSTISRVRPILSKTYPSFDSHRINDQLRAKAFIDELKAYENTPDDTWPSLMILALPADHTNGMKEGFPTPRAMVADNDYALGKIIEAISKSRFWSSTAIFVTEDDSQDGWDHISAYRTTGFIISPYTKRNKVIHTNYNQTCIVRTMEQILGIPPMNIIDASALPMFDCFTDNPDLQGYTAIPNKVPLNEMNQKVALLHGKARHYAIASAGKQFDHIDGGNDDLLNRIIWFAAKGDRSYPSKWAGKDGDKD
ncbi:MAG TPA: alkaline phosphatase family protein [Flavipsychrobacter sp.]|nr:alkaline phosphatase family protein [Flavipsychrobacter sp.]